MESDLRNRPVERGGAEAEDAAVGGNEPVAGATGGRGDAHDGRCSGGASHGAVEARRAEGEDAPSDPTSQYRGRRADGNDWVFPWHRSRARPAPRERPACQSPRPTKVTVCPSGPTVQTASRNGGDRSGTVTRCRHGCGEVPNSMAPGRDIGDHRSRRVRGDSDRLGPCPLAAK